MCIIIRNTVGNAVDSADISRRCPAVFSRAWAMTVYNRPKRSETYCMIDVLYAKRDGRECRGFEINRPFGCESYTFVRFLCEVEILTADGWQRAGAGSFIVYSPYHPQRWICSKSELRHDWLHAVGDDVANVLREYRIETNRVYSNTRGHGIGDAFGELENECRLRGKWSDKLCSVKAEELIIRLARAAAEADSVRFDREIVRIVTEARAKILSDISGSIKVSKAAQSLAISPAYFYRVYRELFGASPKEELTAARIRAAKGELLSGKSGRETAMSVGYASEYQFIRQFKAVTGMTPGEFRGGRG